MLNAKCDKILGENSELHKEVDNRDLEIENLENALVRKNQEIEKQEADMISQLEKMQHGIDMMETKHKNEFQQQNKRHEQEFQTLLQNFQTEKDDLLSKLDHSDSQNQILTKKNEKMKVEIEELQGQIANLENNV